MKDCCEDVTKLLLLLYNPEYENTTTVQRDSSCPMTQRTAGVNTV